jgi:hypothetical protein
LDVDASRGALLAGFDDDDDAVVISSTPFDGDVAALTLLEGVVSRKRLRQDGSACRRRPSTDESGRSCSASALEAADAEGREKKTWISRQAWTMAVDSTAQQAKQRFRPYSYVLLRTHTHPTQ